MNRRDCLKGSAALLAGSAVFGCSDERDSRRPSTAYAREAYDQGVVPIDVSGWTYPRGVMPGYASLEGDVDTDVVVVGAGLAGASLALHLAQAGIAVTVLEARQPGWGASGRNAGHVGPYFQSDLEDIRRFPDGGKKFLELLREHHLITFDLAKKHNIDCDAVQSGYLNVMRWKSTFQHVSEKAARLQKELGVKAERLAAPEVQKLTGSTYYPYGVFLEAGGRVNPYLFTNGMVSAAVRDGAAVYGESEALELVQAGVRWRIATARGSVTAARVVFCTNAYPSGIVPEFVNSFYPMTAYGLSTQPLSQEVRELIMPSGATLSPLDVDSVSLNPFIIDGEGRIVTASIPSVSRPEDATWYFGNHLAWIHRTWPQTKDLDIRLQTYWTGRVALLDQEFPGAFEMQPGVFGLMYFNASGNLRAPLMGKLFAEALARDRLDELPFPLEKPQPVADPSKQSFRIRTLMVPAARLAAKLGII